MICCSDSPGSTQMMFGSFVPPFTGCSLRCDPQPTSLNSFSNASLRSGFFTAARCKRCSTIARFGSLNVNCCAHTVEVTAISSANECFIGLTLAAVQAVQLVQECYFLLRRQ